MNQNADPNHENTSLPLQWPPNPLPDMDTYEDAVALTDKELDPFFVQAFKLKGWLAELLAEGLVRLAPGSQQPCGSPQTGQAWRGFVDAFGGLSDSSLFGALRVAHRFSHCTHPLPELLLRAYSALDIEHTVTGDYIGHRTPRGFMEMGASARLLMRRTAQRWCEWLDALIHLETHGHCQLARSQPGLDLKSEVVAFGLHLCWLPMPPQSIDPQHPGSECWPRREIETLLIALQPLATRNRWSCGDLLRVVRKLLVRPLDYPCWSEADLARYRHNVLALPPLPAGPAPEDKDLFPAGWDVAVCICPPEKGLFPEQPIWS